MKNFTDKVKLEINSMLEIGMISKAKAAKMIKMAEKEADEYSHMRVTEYCDLLSDLN